MAFNSIIRFDIVDDIRRGQKCCCTNIVVRNSNYLVGFLNLINICDMVIISFHGSNEFV